MRTRSICSWLVFAALIASKCHEAVRVIAVNQAFKGEDDASATSLTSSVHDGAVNSTARSQCIFTDGFRRQLYGKMWQFMNPKMMHTMFPKMTLTTTPGVEDFDGHGGTGWPRAYYKTMCFKGDRNAGGHYVYVDNTGDALGSYEKGLLIREEDDGICHGAALCFWRFYQEGAKEFNLQVNPATFPYQKGNPQASDRLEAFKHNYRTVLKLYVDLIETGKWDQALWQVWHTDVNSPITVRENTDVHGRAATGRWTFQETVDSLAHIKQYLGRFAPFPVQGCVPPASRYFG